MQRDLGPRCPHGACLRPPGSLRSTSFIHNPPLGQLFLIFGICTQYALRIRLLGMRMHPGGNVCSWCMSCGACVLSTFLSSGSFTVRFAKMTLWGTSTKPLGLLHSLFSSGFLFFAYLYIGFIYAQEQKKTINQKREKRKKTCHQVSNSLRLLSKASLMASGSPRIRTFPIPLGKCK